VKSHLFDRGFAGLVLQMKEGFPILIAEDSEDDALILNHALRFAGIKHPIHIVPDGGIAIKYLRGEEIYADRARFPFPKALFTDIKMPRVNGFDLLAWLRANPQFRVIPTMVFTSSGNPSDVSKAYDLGANAYIQKPHDLHSLMDLITVTLKFWGRCLAPE
jgi:CheY-like chemotaxis protein